MNIIFDNSVELISESFTKLQLDTFKDKRTGKTHIAWCILEDIPLEDFPLLEHLVATHQQLVNEYKNKNWDYCLSAIQALRGRWNGEIDSYYDNLETRIQTYSQGELEDGWDGIIER